MNRKIILFFFLVGAMILLSTDAYSQTGKKVAPFRIAMTNGSVFKAEDLPVGKPIVLIYFSPECEECQKMTEEMLKRMNDFKKASIVMVTYLPVETVKPFISRFSLNMYPNIYVGTEGSAFIVRYYYNITTFPFIAFFNKNGDLVKSYTKEGNIDEMTAILKNL
jgi:hypothetical protein